MTSVTLDPEKKVRLIDAAIEAMPFMTANARAEAELLIADLEGGRSLTDAASAFETDLQPVREALAEALHAGDVPALRGLRAMLPELLREVNASPILADIFAHQLGRAFLDGLNKRRDAE